MPKASDNFLRGWCRQVRQALDDGAELGYEAAELIEELSELLIPDRDSGAEMDSTDSIGDGPDDSDHPGNAQGPEQMHLPGVPGVGADVEHLRGRVDRARSVPRGTGSGAPVLAEQAPVCKRVPRG